MSAHLPTAELDKAIWFSTLSRKSGFLWHSSKWACQFSHFLQYTLGIEVLPCSLDTNFTYVTTMLQMHPSLNHYVVGCILKGRYYIIPPALSLSLGPKVLCWIFSKISKFLRSLAEYLVALAFLCYYIFDSYITCLTPSFNTVYVHFHWY